MTVARNQDGGSGGGESREVVVFAYDYYSGANFTVIAEMQQEAAAAILMEGGVDGDSGQQRRRAEVFEDPYNWDGYIIRFDIGDFGLLTVLFSEEVDFDAGDSATLSRDTSFRSTDMNFIEVELDDAGGGGTASSAAVAGGGDITGVDVSITIGNETDGN